MSEKTEAMKRSVARDEQRVRDLQESIRARKEKIRKLEDDEILSDLNTLSTHGLSVREIVTAMKDRDADKLFRLVEGNDSEENVLQNKKEVTENEPV